MKYFIFIILILDFLVSKDDLSSLKREKLEVIELKKELNDFYNKKEKEYQDRKKELETIQQNIEKERKNIKNLYDNNLKLLQDIEQTVASKTTKVFNGMKPKVAASIFNEMMSEGKIEDVFDIIIRLKEKKITALMKYLNISNASLLTQMMERYKADTKNKE